MKRAIAASIPNGLVHRAEPKVRVREKWTRFSAPNAALIKGGASKAPGSNGLVVVTPNRAARRPAGHAGHAAWRPRSADDGLSGVA
ncbi:hypothetical protein, partial [Microvirga sp. P5_D2]